MEKRVNYEDNAFIINTRIRLLNEIFLLEADPELFFDKTLDELDFINNTLHALLNNLLANEKLIERDEQFHNLLETEWQFTSLLNYLISGQGSLAGCFSPKLIPKLESLRNDCTKRQMAIQEKTSDDGEDRADARVVSPFELAELLKV
jgi:hypothetical protein